jgi:hypothetical protein
MAPYSTYQTRPPESDQTVCSSSRLAMVEDLLYHYLLLCFGNSPRASGVWSAAGGGIGLVTVSHPVVGKLTKLIRASAVFLYVMKVPWQYPAFFNTA